jgi:hypothetical protein
MLEENFAVFLKQPEEVGFETEVAIEILTGLGVEKKVATENEGKTATVELAYAKCDEERGAE